MADMPQMQEHFAALSALRRPLRAVSVLREKA
jgi:hypothetical protein